MPRCNGLELRTSTRLLRVGILLRDQADITDPHTRSLTLALPACPTAAVGRPVTGRWGRLLQPVPPLCCRARAIIFEALTLDPPVTKPWVPCAALAPRRQAPNLAAAALPGRPAWATRAATSCLWGAASGWLQGRGSDGLPGLSPCPLPPAALAQRPSGRPRARGTAVAARALHSCSVGQCGATPAWLCTRAWRVDMARRCQHAWTLARTDIRPALICAGTSRALAVGPA